MRLPQENKPSPCLGIDWSHPRSCGLGAAWLLNEGAGTLANDLVGRVAAVTSQGGMWGAGGMKFSGSNYAGFSHDTSGTS